MTGVLLSLMLAWAPPSDSLDQIKKEPDLVRRSERALDFSEASIEKARHIVREGGTRTDLFQILGEATEAAELSLSSLRQTGKKASKLSKQYKRGELRTRGIVRQLGDVAAGLGIDDRPEAEKLRDRVTIVHEEYLLGIMSGK